MSSLKRGFDGICERVNGEEERWSRVGGHGGERSPSSLFMSSSGSPSRSAIPRNHCDQSVV